MTVSRQALTLSGDEEKLFECLDKFVQHVRTAEPSHATLEARIAGGWVRDKLLSKACYDCDVAISNMKGLDFATRFVPFYQSYFGLPPDNIRVAEIKANPEQSKHLDTATVSLLGQGGDASHPRKLDLDFCQLRSEEYAEGSRIPTDVRFGTPLEDALRRDLTINSLFYNIHTQLVEDHTDKGLTDLLVAPLIRTPLEPRQTFLDDPLRILRCIRFAVRFGFPLNDDIRKAVLLPDVRDALASKVSRERIGIEIKKMLSSSGAVEAIAYIIDLGLYDVVFAGPARATQKFDDLRSAIRLARHLRSLLDPAASSTSSSLRRDVHPPDAFALSLAASLLPYRGHTFVDKKGKSVEVPPAVVGEALKLPNDDAQYVAQLFSSASLLSASTMSDFRGPDERVVLGLLLPRLTGIKGPTWRTSLLFCLALDLLPQTDVTQRASTIDAYGDFAARIVDLHLDVDAFAKPVLNGRDAMSMGVQGKAIDGFLKAVMRWQLAHPGDDATSCRAHMEAWLEEERANGRLDVAPPVSKKVKR